MTVLVVYAAATRAPPAVNGLYPGDQVAFEMFVKDADQHQEVWGYYSFGTGPVGTLNAPDTCFTCHDDHAETDRVFTQFYPNLQ